MGKRRRVTFSIENLSQELVKKKVEEPKQCLECKYLKSFYLKFSPCCGCKNKSNYEY